MRWGHFQRIGAGAIDKAVESVATPTVRVRRSLLDGPGRRAFSAYRGSRPDAQEIGCQRPSRSPSNGAKFAL